MKKASWETNVMGDYLGFNQKSVWGINKGILDHQSSLGFINEFKQHFVLMLLLCVCVCALLELPAVSAADAVKGCGSNTAQFNQIAGKSDKSQPNWLLRWQKHKRG